MLIIFVVILLRKYLVLFRSLSSMAPLPGSLLLRAEAMILDAEGVRFEKDARLF